MSSVASKLSGIARAKLAVGSSIKDTCSLHRWVLLKNSIIRSRPSSPSPTESTAAFNPNVHYVYTQNSPDEDLEEECDSEEQEEQDAFVFPDPDALLDTSSDQDTAISEAQWLDSLLETLSDDIRDDISTHSRDEEDVFFGQSLSSFSSSEDLVNNSGFYQSSPVPVPYPVPYPPLFHAPLIRSEEFRCSCDTVDESHRVEDGLPYYDVDDLDDLSVPEAIEDTSDDESEIVTTPLCRSSSSIAVDPASVPLPPDARPHVYIDMDDPFVYHLRALDALPFAGNSREYESAVYQNQEC